MRKLILAVTIGAACAGIAACSQKAETTTNAETVTEAVTETETETTTETAAETEEQPETETETTEAESESEESDASESETELDNFTVDTEAVAEMAKEIQAAVEAKDLEALSELSGYPVYVGLEDGKTVETKEDFLALGADAVFTEELVQSVSGCDVTGLEASKAGFVLSSEESTANIIFGVADGELKITGINY